jgi:hypothetical protein
VPFQGVIRLVPTSSQGVALGWILAAFQAEIVSSGGNPSAIAVTYPPELSQLLFTRPNVQNSAFLLLRFGFPVLVICICFGFRYSDFGFGS